MSNNVENVAKVSKVKVEAKRGRGRPAAFEAKKAVAAVLRGDGDVSYYLKRQLVSQGYFTVVPVKADTRGRPAFNYVLTSKGKGLVNLSKNWGVKKVTVVTEAVEAFDMTAANANVEAHQEAVSA